MTSTPDHDGAVTIEELLRLVESGGVSCRAKRDEVAIEVCCYCGNAKFNLELNPGRAVFYCWACRTGGPLGAVIRQLTGHAIDVRADPNARRAERARRAQAPAAAEALQFQATALRDSSVAVAYLTARRLTLAEAVAYGLVVCAQPDHRLYGRLAIPALDYWTQRQIGWVGRTMTNQRPKYLSTLQTQTVFGWRGQAGAPIVVVEGPFDGLAVHRAGCTAAVLGGVSTPDATAWAARLPSDAQLTVMLDGEAVDVATKLYWQLAQVAPGRVAFARLPVGEDPASIGPQGVITHLSAAWCT